MENENIEIWCRDCNNIIDITEEHYCSTSNSNNIIDITEEKDCSISNSKNDYTDYIERLIAAVFEREPLWKSSLLYRLRGPSVIKALWTDIDNCLETTLGTSQTKWKNLRDRFVKEHTLECAYIPSGSAAVKKKSNWPFYESLRFLTPTINYRSTISNIENIDPTLSSSSVKKETEQSIFLPVPGTSYSTKKVLQKKSLLKPLIQSRRNHSPQLHIPESNNSIQITTQSLTSTTDEAESMCKTKRIKKAKVEKSDTSSHFEEAILRELAWTGPANESHINKHDEIESFVRYLEACLRRMSADVSKYITKNILKLVAEEDI